MTLALAGVISAATAAETPPNFLLIIADDCSHSELPLFGGRNVATPRIDRLAEEGMLFRSAYVSMSMCVPCRAELYTGLYPLRSGVCWNHSSATPGIESIVQHLGRLGYRTGIAGKVHATPRAVFPFEMVGGFERNCVAETAAHDVSGIRAFMTRDPSGPFCLIVGLVVPHAPWTVGDPSAFDCAKLVLPPHFPDTPETRESLAKYLAEIAHLDVQVGDVLKALDAAGQAGRTVVMFTSEQGGQWPGCKWTNWNQGLHTALIVRWPGRVTPGAKTDALVQYADVLPTFLDIAGGKPEALGLDGTSFLRVLTGERDTHRRFAYAMHNNVPEGPPYPIRSVTDGSFRYIRNLLPDALYIEKHVMGSTAHNPYWLSWLWASETDPHAYAMVRRYMRRPAEELYDTSADSFELANLAADPAHAARKAALAAELDRWLAEQDDPGAPLDTQEALRRNREAAKEQRR
ncbi:MAG TPA: heparan N-sulfatase [Planctomycetes bacterium]|nr:heparan N-sulfatase [Planctomycetota bacterium]